MWLLFEPEPAEEQPEPEKKDVGLKVAARQPSPLQYKKNCLRSGPRPPGDRNRPENHPRLVGLVVRLTTQRRARDSRTSRPLDSPRIQAIRRSSAVYAARWAT